GAAERGEARPPEGDRAGTGGGGGRTAAERGRRRGGVRRGGGVPGAPGAALDARARGGDRGGAGAGERAGAGDAGGGAPAPARRLLSRRADTARTVALPTGRGYPGRRASAMCSPTSRATRTAR